MARLLQFPRPRSIFYLIPLRTAAEFIALTLLINKVTGFYGILALFTGYHLNPLQLSHYIYSLCILGLAGWLSPAIKKPNAPLKNLALAWVYVLDTFINGIYTTLFGMGWFVLLAQQNGLLDPAISAPGTGKGTMDDTAGFTDPAMNVTKVDVLVRPGGFPPGQEAVAYPSTATGADAHAASTAAGGALGAAVLRSDSISSLVLLGLLWLIRVYFCVVMLSHARSILRQYIATSSAAAAATSSNPFAAGDESTTDVTTPGAVADPTMAESPFALGREKGAGWPGALGRAMTRAPTKRYWFGRDSDAGVGLSEWERATSGRFESGRKSLHIAVPDRGGVLERERRARSGTGPPAASFGKEGKEGQVL